MISERVFFVVADPFFRSDGTLSTIKYPRCTISSLDEHESDCGSVGWAYTLFIAWNILSMVRLFFSLRSIFLN
jgi:hypothetical protein